MYVLLSTKLTRLPLRGMVGKLSNWKSVFCGLSKILVNFREGARYHGRQHTSTVGDSCFGDAGGSGRGGWPVLFVYLKY